MITGDIILFKRNKGFISWVISLLTMSEYTHVAIALDSRRILEANRFIKSRIVYLDVDAELHSIYRIENLTDFHKLNIMNLIKAFEGYPYDYKQIYRWFMLLAFNREVSVVNRANALFCSEIVDYVLNNAQVPRGNKYPLGEVLPHMLIEVYDAKWIY